MKVLSVTSNKYITPKTTGYAALSGLGLTVLSGMSKNRNIRKSHKLFAIATMLFTALHVGLTEYYHNRYKSKK